MELLQYTAALRAPYKGPFGRRRDAFARECRGLIAAFWRAVSSNPTSVTLGRHRLIGARSFVCAYSRYGRVGRDTC